MAARSNNAKISVVNGVVVTVNCATVLGRYPYQLLVIASINNTSKYWYRQ
jgi:hypothetical protein